MRDAREAKSAPTALDKGPLIDGVRETQAFTIHHNCKRSLSFLHQEKSITLARTATDRKSGDPPIEERASEKSGPVWRELRGYDGSWAGLGLGSVDGETNPFGKLQHVSEND